MSQQPFAQRARTAPTLVPGAQHTFTCHVAALYWAFHDLTNNATEAAAMVEAIAKANCQRCREPGGGGGIQQGHHSIPHPWYGRNLCRGALAVSDSTALQAYAEVGDVLLVGDPSRPSHSMVVVNKSLLGQGLHVRGYNNFLTLGTGRRDAYDPQDRDVGVMQFWHRQGNVTHFGQGYAMGGPLYRVPYGTYVLGHADALRRKFQGLGGQFQYVGG